MLYNKTPIGNAGSSRRRQRSYLWLLWAGLVLVLGAAGETPAAEGPQVQLAAGGQARLPITAVDPDGQFNKAFLIAPSLQDLEQTLERLAGADFERKSVPAVPDAAPPAIYVGLAKDLAALGVPQDLGLDECYIATTAGGSLILSGADPRGVSHAIYRMLHHLGCRWYYPGEEWAVIPNRPDLAVSFDRREQPDFPIQRRIWVGHGLHGEPRPPFDAWQRRNLVAQPFDVSTGETWFGINPKSDFEAHPEWFAEVDGKRQPTKPAFTNPEVIQKAIDHALAYFAANPDKQMVSLNPPDGLGYDTSDEAIAQAKVVETFQAHNTLFGRQADGTLVSVVSENVFHFVNEVARALQREYPGKMVGVLAYSAHSHPPSFPLEPNVYVEMTSGYRYTPLSMVEQIVAFSEKAENLGIYEYYDVEQWSWDLPGRARAADLNYLQSSFRFYRRYNMTALSGEMSSNFGPNGVGYYVIARLLWDATQDVRAIEDEFYERAFGPAAEPLRRIYRRWEEGHGREEPYLAATYRDLAEATSLTDSDSLYRKRINRIKMYAHFLKIYLKPSDGMSTFKINLGEEEARKRVDALADWAARISLVHMVHGQAFNDYFRKKGKEMLGLDPSDWGKAGVPSEEEVEAVFSRGLEELKDVPPPPDPVDVYSKRLRPVSDGASVSATGQSSGTLQTIDKATIIIKLDAGETAALKFNGEEAKYSVSYLLTEDFEGDMTESFATPVASGAIESGMLEFEAPEAGYYLVHIKGGTVESVSHPHAVPQDRLSFADGRLYFFVPKGTRQFTYQVHARGAPTVKLRDPAGNLMVDQDGFAVTKNLVAAVKLPREWTVDVPEGADGGVWSVEGPANVYKKSSPILSGVPPYYALDPALLLVPEETR